MKRLIVLILMAALLPHAAIAQTGLHSDAVFKGQVVPQNAMVEVKVRGRTLSRYRDVLPQRTFQRHGAAESIHQQPR